MPAESAQRFLLVVGRSCTGKTLFGAHAATVAGVLHLEASEVLRRSLPESLRRSGRADGAQALSALGGAFVAERAIEMLRGRTDSTVVVTGFRTVEELDRFTGYAPLSEVVYLHAPAHLRVERCRSRDRGDFAADLASLRALDLESWRTLLPVARHVARFRIVNAWSLADYQHAVETVLRGAGTARGLAVLRARPWEHRPYVQLRRALRGLPLEEGDVSTLARYPQLATSLQAGAGSRIGLTPAGCAYVSSVERMRDSVSPGPARSGAASSS